MVDIWVATRAGVHVVRGGDVTVELPERSVSFLATSGDELRAIVDGSEIWGRAKDGVWTHVATVDGLRANAIAFTDRWLVGTSEAHLLELIDRRPERIASFDAVDGRDDWYTPWGGPPDTRSFSAWDEHVFVNVHVGGIAHTIDGGATWTPTIDIDADVHQVTTTERLVLAACAGGLAVSRDRGDTWSERTDGLEHVYSRAVTVIGDTVLVSASRGPRGGEAAVYRGALAGGAFERCRTGLPRWFDDKVDSHCLDAPPDGPLVAFGTSDGDVYASGDAGASWERMATGLPAVQRVLVLP
jgi:hypothetical protein